MQLQVGQNLLRQSFLRAAVMILPLSLSTMALGQTTQPSEGPMQPSTSQGESSGSPTVMSMPQLPLVSLQTGRSTMIQSPWPIKQASTSEPKAADIQLISPTQVLISAKAAGAADIVLLGEPGQMEDIPVRVSVDQSGIGAGLDKLLPGSHIDVQFDNGVVVVNGTLLRAADVDSLHRYLDAVAPKYVDNTTLAGPQQVELKVMLAEANRTAIRTLGINAFQSGTNGFGGSVIGPDGGTPINPVSIGVPSGASASSAVAPFQFLSDTTVEPAATLFGGFPGANLEIFVQALAENDYLRVLAEPTLVAYNGKDADFLAGGEFPIPVVQSSSGTAPTISIDYKQFGVLLNFRPIVLGDGRIRLIVAPEVSELSSSQGSIEIEGFNIPSILVRRASTTLEINSGQTFGMAGLINRETQARSTRVPGLGDLPIIGALFRSVRYQEGDTDLVLLVTASLVEPQSINGTPPLPGVAHIVPNDWDLYAMGHIEGSQQGGLSPEDSKRVHDAGLNRLVGPGAWASYDQPTVKQ